MYATGMPQDPSSAGRQAADASVHAARPGGPSSRSGGRSSGPGGRPSAPGGHSSAAGGRRSGASGHASHVSGDRYEPLPGLTRLPGWIWRRLPRPAKVGVALLPLVAVGLVLALGPGIERGKEERATTEAQRLERAREARIERVRREQQPHFGRGEAAAASLPARRRLLAEAAVAVRTEARERAEAGALSGPIQSVQCEPYPRTIERSGAHEDLARSVGRYACLAVTTEIPATAEHEAGAIGHPYRVRIDFDNGRFAFCKVSGRAGEGSIGQAPVVPVPAACGGS
jgi:hypothetical protein